MFRYRNTGKKKYTKLEEYNLTTGEKTGRVKQNLSSDPDYIAPIVDFEECQVPDVKRDISQIKAIVKNNSQEHIFFEKVKVAVDNSNIPLFDSPFRKGPGLLEEGEYANWLGDFVQMELNLADEKQLKNRPSVEIVLIVEGEGETALRTIKFISNRRRSVENLPLPYVDRIGKRGVIELRVNSVVEQTTTTTTTSTTSTTTTTTTFKEEILTRHYKTSIESGGCNFVTDTGFGSIKCSYQRAIDMQKLLGEDLLFYRITNVRATNPNRRNSVSLEVEGVDLSKNTEQSIRPLAKIEWYKSTEEDNSSQTELICDIYYEREGGEKVKGTLLIYAVAPKKWVENEGYCETKEV